MFEDEEDYGPDDTIRAHGYDPRFTPIDTLMAAPLPMHLEYHEQHMDN